MDELKDWVLVFCVFAFGMVIAGTAAYIWLIVLGLRT
jgi:hypothetical protein